MSASESACGEQAEDDVACFSVLTCLHRAMNLCIITPVTENLVMWCSLAHVPPPTGSDSRCVFVLCLSECLCELVHVSFRALYSPDS